MTREQKLWLSITIFLFVVLMAFGWYYTVAQALRRSFADSHQSIASQLDQTKQQFVGTSDLGQASQETVDKVKTFFQNTKQNLENKQKAEQAILDNVKEEIKTSSH